MFQASPGQSTLVWRCRPLRSCFTLRGMPNRVGHGCPSGSGCTPVIAYVGAVGSEGAVSDVTVLGDAANIAARLASSAGPGEVLISASASAATRTDLDGLEQRNLQLKGRSESVDV